jgi:hypothetical protein
MVGKTKVMFAKLRIIIKGVASMPAIVQSEISVQFLLTRMLPSQFHMEKVHLIKPLHYQPSIPISSSTFFPFLSSKCVVTTRYRFDTDMAAQTAKDRDHEANARILSASIWRG